MDLTIYALWDAQQIQYVLNAIAILMNTGDYVGLIRTFAILGLFIAVAAGFVRARGEEAVYYIIIMAMFYGALFLPKRDVVIQDMSTGTGTYAVANVPLGLAFLASAESHIGYWLTKSMETVFALPDDIKFHKSGYMFASRAITERQNMRFHDKRVFSSLASFTKDCFYPELSVNPDFYDNIMKTGDMWTEIGTSLNPARLTSIYDTDVARYEIMQCDQAYAKLGPMLDAEVQGSLFPSLAARLNKTVTPAIASGMLAAQMNASDEIVLGASRDAMQGIKQAAMINLLFDSASFVPAMVGDAEGAQVALSTAIAARNAEMSYKTMAKLSESTLPLIRSSIHMVILAIFPILMAMIVMAGARAGKILQTYGFGLLWINLWAPLFAVVNFLMTWHATNGARAATLGMDSLSAGSAIAMSNALISEQAIAGILVISVPIIAFMLTNVSASSFTSVISGMMAPSGSAAQSAGTQVGSGNTSVGNGSWGNIQMGNWSWNNRSQDQWNTAPSNTYGAGTATEILANGGKVTSFESGQSALNMSGTVSQLGRLGVGGSSMIQHAASEKSAENYSSAASHTTASMSALNAGYSKAKDFLQGHKVGDGIATSSQIGDMNDFVKGMDTSKQIAAKWDSGIKMSDSQKADFIASASAGVGINTAFARAGVASELKGTSSSTLQATYDSARSYAESSGYNESVRNSQQIGSKIATSHGSESYNQATQGLRADLSDSKSSQEQSQIALQRAKSYEQVANETRSQGAQADVNFANQVVRDLGGDRAASDYLANKDETQLAHYGQRIASQIADQLADTKFTGNAQQNSEIKQTAIAGTPSLDQAPSEFKQQADTTVAAKNTEDRAHVGGNAHAGPAINIGTAANPNIQSDKTMDKAVATTGRSTEATILRGGKNEVETGNRSVAAPVETQIDAGRKGSLAVRAGSHVGSNVGEGSPADSIKKRDDNSGPPRG